MTRLPDWNVRYHDFIDELRRVPFEWGINDCGPAWAGRAVSVMTGRENPLAEYQGKYKTALGAVKVMKESGFENLKDLVADKMGKPLHPSAANIGDIAVIKDDSPFGYSLGIVNGDRVFFRGESNIGTVDLLECDSIFKV